MGYQSEVIITLEHDAFYMAESIELFKDADILMRNKYGTMYCFDEIKWYQGYGHIDKTDAFLRRFNNYGQVTFSRIGESFGDHAYIGDPDERGIDIKVNLVINDTQFDLGVAVVINKRLYSEMDSFLEKNTELNVRFNNAIISSDESDKFLYFSHEDFKEFSELKTFLFAQNPEHYCVAKSTLDGFEEQGNSDYEIYQDESLIYDDFELVTQHKNVDETTLKILDAIEGEWIDQQILDVNKPFSDAGRTYIMHAVRFVNIAAIDALLAQGANPGQENKHGVNAVIESLFVGNELVIDKMFSSGVDLNTWTFMDILKENIEHLPLFIKHGFDINLQDEKGNSLLMYFIPLKTKVEALLKYDNIDFSIKNNDGMTVFDISKNDEITSMLENYALKKEILEDDIMSLSL